MYHSLKNDPTKGDQSTANTFDLYLTKGPGVKFDLQLNHKLVVLFCGPKLSKVRYFRFLNLQSTKDFVSLESKP